MRHSKVFDREIADNNTVQIRGHFIKKYEIIWEFFPIVGPSPHIWEAPVQKNKGLFCVLGPKENFWFLQKCSLFVSILTYTFGNRGPSPTPPSRKNSQIIPFLPKFFPELTDQDQKSNYLKVINNKVMGIGNGQW